MDSFSLQEIHEALAETGGDVELARDVVAHAEFHSPRTVIASGKLTRELEDKRRELEERMRRDQEELQKVIQKEDQLREQKEAKQRAVAIARAVEEAVPEDVAIADAAPDDGDVVISDAEEEKPSYEDVLAIMQSHLFSSGSDYWFPFWYSKDFLTSEDKSKLRFPTLWASTMGEEWKLKGFETGYQAGVRKIKAKFEKGGRKLSAPLDIRYGIIMSEKTTNLPFMIAKRLKDQQKRAKATHDACLRAMMEIIPGIQGYLKKGKGRIVSPSTFQLTNVRNDKYWFGIRMGTDGKPGLYYGGRAYDLSESRRDDWQNASNILSAVALSNVVKLLEGYEKFYQQPLNVSAVASRFAPHVLATRDLDDDPTVYMTKAQAENDLAAEEAERTRLTNQRNEEAAQKWITEQNIQDGDLLVRYDFFDSRSGGHRKPEFYRVTAQGGLLTDGKGGLFLRAYRSVQMQGWGAEKVGRPRPEDLFPDVVAYPGAISMNKVPPGQMEFVAESWMGD